MASPARMAAILAAALAVPAAASPSQTFTDPVGDAPPTTDIASVVASDDGQGALTIQVSIPGLQALPPNLAVVAAIDADMNRLTGSQDPSDQGTDALVFSDGSNLFASTWSGADFTRTDISAARPAPATSFAAGILTLTIPTQALHITEGIRFDVESALFAADGSVDRASFDAAPGAGTWTYLLGPPKLTLLRPAITPAHPPAGGRFTAAMVVRESVTGRPAGAGTVTCRFTVGGRRVAGVKGAVTASGRVSCAGAVPASAAKSPLRGTIEYRYRGVTVRQAFSARVR